MKISVITAVYNREDTIGHALRSVQSQTYGNWESVIQDGGSKDRTIELVERLANDRTFLRSEPDGGIYDAINRGISRATGDVIGLMHSDDFFAHDRVLERVADVMQDTSVDGVYGDLQYVAADQPTRIIRHWRSGVYSPTKLARGWMPPHPTLYLRRAVFERWGLYDTSLRIAADYDAILRYLIQGQIKLAYIPEVMVKMRVGGESNRSLARIVLKSREDFQAIKRNGIGGYGTLAFKNFGKIGQFIWKD